MKSNVLIPIFLLIALTGCVTNYAPGSPEALDAATHRELMNECMSHQMENILEMASIDPTFIYRRCRQYADIRVRHP